MAASITTSVSGTITDAPTTTFSLFTASPTSTVTCTTAVPGKNGRVPLDACNSKYPYEPSLAAAIAFAALFAVATVIHIMLAVFHKKRFCWVITMGCIWESGAFVFRIVGYYFQQELIWVVLGTLGLLLAPLWINAFVYMTVARMIYMYIPDRQVLRLKAESIAKYFVWFDIISFLIQALSGAMLASQGDSEVVRIGFIIYRVGIALQEVVILCFLVVIINFEIRMTRLIASGEINPTRWWRILTWTQYVVSAMITMRIVFRFVEYSSGYSYENELVSEEGYLLGLEAAPMLLSVILMAIVHPGLVLKGPNGEFPKLTRREKKQRKRERKMEKELRKKAKREEEDGQLELEHRGSTSGNGLLRGSNV